MPATNPGTVGLSAWWALEEASGTRYDSHSTNHLSPSGTPVNGTGKQGSAVDLESSNNEYLTIAAASQTGLGSAGSFAFGAWYKLESTATRFICSKRDGGAAEFTMTTAGPGDPAGVAFYLANGFGSQVVTGCLSVGAWSFLVVGYNSATGKNCVSVNGAAPTLQSMAYSGLASAPFNIGYDLSGGLPKWDGLIDEAFYYTRWLTDDELTWLYNAGSGRSYSEVIGGQPTTLRHGATGRRLFGPRIGAGGW